MARQRERKGGLSADPGTLEWMQRAARNKASLTKKQLYDAERVRVRVDVPDWLKARLTEIAKENGTSVTQVSAWALAWWVMLYERSDPQLHEALAASYTISRSIKVNVDLSLDRVIERLTNSAEPLSSAV